MIKREVKEMREYTTKEKIREQLISSLTTGEVAYTIQKCKKCGAVVEIDALEFLINLDEEVICKECMKEKVEEALGIVKSK